MNIQLLNIDCLEYLKSVPNEFFDCCITDPPYGINFQSARRTEKKDWKPKILNDESPFTEWINPLFNKMKEGARLICFYRWDVQDHFLEEIMSAGFTVKSQIVWDKVSHGMGDLSGEFAPQHELMIYATKGRYQFIGNRPKTVYRCLRIMPENLIHPNEKPVNLLSAIIRDITEKGEKIFDPFGGSFATALACKNENRDCVSTELLTTYYELGVKRFNTQKNQLKIF